MRDGAGVLARRVDTFATDFEAKVKVKELLKDKRSVSFATTTSATRVFSEGHHLTLGGRFVLNGIEMKEDGTIESIEAMGFMRHQYTFNNGLKLNSALFVRDILCFFLSSSHTHTHTKYTDGCCHASSRK